MSSVPPTGQLSVSQIMSAANDQYNTSDFNTNVSLSDLRARLKQGQSYAPGTNSNVSFSSTRRSQFITYKITSWPESVSTYNTNDNGVIEVDVDETKLEGNGTSITVSLNTGQTSTKNISGAVSNIFQFVSLAGKAWYTVTVRDNNTGHSVSDNIYVSYGGSQNTVYRNRA